MRTHNNSKLPNLALVGLLVAVALLAYSYWNVSWKNASLTKDLEDTIAELKKEKATRSDCLKHRGTMEEKLKESLFDLDKEKMQSKAIEKEHTACRVDLSDVQHEYELTKNDVTVCQSKMTENEDTIAKLKQDKDAMQANFDKCLQDVDSEKSLHEGDKQQATVECDRKIEDLRLSVLQQVKDVSGVDALIALQRRGVDVAGISLEKPPAVDQKLYAGDKQQQPQVREGANPGVNAPRVHLQESAGAGDADAKQQGATYNNNNLVPAVELSNSNNARLSDNVNNDNDASGRLSNGRQAVVDPQSQGNNNQPAVVEPLNGQPQAYVDNRNVAANSNNVNNNNVLLPNNGQSALNAGASSNQETYRRSGDARAPIDGGQNALPEAAAIAVGDGLNSPAAVNPVDIPLARQGAAAGAGAPPPAGAGMVWQPAPLLGAAGDNNLQRNVAPVPRLPPADADAAAAAAQVPAGLAAAPAAVDAVPAAPAPQPWQPGDEADTFDDGDNDVMYEQELENLQLQQQQQQMLLAATTPLIDVDVPAIVDNDDDESRMYYDAGNSQQQQIAEPLMGARAGDGGVDRSALGERAVAAALPLPAIVPAAPAGDSQVAPAEVDDGARGSNVNVDEAAAAAAAAGAGVEDGADGNDRLEAIRQDKMGAGVEDKGPDAKGEDDYEDDVNKGVPPAAQV